MTLPMIATFVANPIINRVGNTIQFMDTSVGGATAWNWSFGDDTISDLQNPTHEYSIMGDYDVILNISREVY
jgi:PKD repeat protein